MAELYFESLEGASNPARFTPMNDDVRRAFRDAGRLRPEVAVRSEIAIYASGHNQAGLRKFLDFRAALASRMQADWLDVLDQVRGRSHGWMLCLPISTTGWNPGCAMR